MQNRTRIYTVSQVNSLIKEVLENNLPSRLAITGEITNWSIARSGHVYFDLKDENALLPCVCWRSKLDRIKFEPENGLAVIAKGYIDVYSPHGKFQFYVESMIPAGVGALQLAFEQMVKKLQKEGLFDEVHKKPLPAYPQRIGILTSESGAAVHDIKDSIQNRWPPAKLFLYPVPVQGEGAAEEMAAAIRDVNRRNKELKLDILIVGRGGGSLEDLWAFNEEVLARAIFDSEIPVISAVGHEVDTTIADLVADARASTPTKAGVVAVPDMQELLRQLAYFGKSLDSKVKAKLELCENNLQTILASAVFRNPLLPVHNAEQQLDELSVGLADLIKELLAEARAKLHAGFQQIVKIEPHRLLREKMVVLNNLEYRVHIKIQAILNKKVQTISEKTVTLKNAVKSLLDSTRGNLYSGYEQIRKIHPEKILGKKTVDVKNLKNRANAAITGIINDFRMQLTAQTNRLAGLNPKAILRRGYSITTNKKTGLLVRRPEDVQIADCIITELADENLIESRVMKK